jgi:hypothetical protein
MSDLHPERLSNAMFPATRHHESRAMVAVAMTAIAVAFVLSVAVAVSSITHGVKTVASGLPPPTMSAPETTGSGDRS